MARIPPDLELSTADLDQLTQPTVAIRTGDALFRVEGSGTIACLQGQLSNDLVKAADRSAVWGAFLTAKGMIISDAWVLRDGDAAWVAVPAQARETVRALFVRTMPPRLARVTDRSDELTIWLALGNAPADGFLPRESAPFAALAVGAHAAPPPSLTDRAILPPSAADALRFVAGWPTLGREIDERTLPQEARFDELGGIRYDKGCYTGQETMSRLHFRGHANRQLAVIIWPVGSEPGSRDLTSEGKSIGTLRTIARIGDRWAALATVRREVQVGDELAGGVVTTLPFTFAG
ncbi:MAG TPA: hypothetical protein VGM77_01085 [Gemmatimonadales bacterium]|jgi:folate-binding protein YgfZ